MPLELLLSDIPDNGAKIVKIDEKRLIALFRVGDKVAAIDNRCPHRSAPLGMGTFDGTNVKCPLHSFTVNVWTGVGSGGKPVGRYDVTVEGEKVVVAVD